MQKVVGSSPIIRSRKTPAQRAFLFSVVATGVADASGNARVMPKTALELLHEQAAELDALIEELLMQHSGLTKRNLDFDGVAVFTTETHRWNELKVEGRRLQSRILKALDRYAPLLDAVTRLARERDRAPMAEASETLKGIVDQSHGSAS
jgi:hypothetical protein